MCMFYSCDVRSPHLALLCDHLAIVTLNEHSALACDDLALFESLELRLFQTVAPGALSNMVGSGTQNPPQEIPLGQYIGNHKYIQI